MSLKQQFFAKKHTVSKFSFYHEKSVKEVLAYSLFDRAESLCSENDGIKCELKIVASDLIQNGYPKVTIN